MTVTKAPILFNNSYISQLKRKILTKNRWQRAVETIGTKTVFLT